MPYPLAMAFRALFAIATTREGSEVVLITEPPDDLQGANQEPPNDGLGAPSCLWWRRGRVELHLNTYLRVLLAA